ncbi:hypothetical protein [Yeosuana sp.]|uniref:hypothetical protein n=1 Tax=Yeosuana sp. TaxID=2529388 RepID=UPI00405523E2
MANIRENSGVITKQSDTLFTVTYHDIDGTELEKHFSTYAEAWAFCKKNNLGC